MTDFAQKKDPAGWTSCMDLLALCGEAVPGLSSSQVKLALQQSPWVGYAAGESVHVSEGCSVRRNWQAPSPFLKASVRKVMGAISVPRPHVQSYTHML